MAEVLSQSQIDELLKAAKSGNSSVVKSSEDGTDKQYRKYDFYSPKKFSKDRLKLINSIYENYCRILSSHLTSMFRYACEVEVASIEEQRYFEFNNALSETDILALIDINILDKRIGTEPVLFQISNQVIYGMIDRMLGGLGSDPEDIDAGYTEVELTLYETITKQTARVMKDAWANYLNIEFAYYRYETNPRLIQSINMDEIVVIIVLDVKTEYNEGKFNICIPGNTLGSILKEIEIVNASNLRQNREKEDTSQEILSSLKNSSLEIKAKFNDIEVLLSDINYLQVGDIINLNKPKDSDIILCVENTPWFKGQLGTQKQNVAIKLTDEVKKPK